MTNVLAYYGALNKNMINNKLAVNPDAGDGTDTKSHPDIVYNRCTDSKCITIFNNNSLLLSMQSESGDRTLLRDTDNNGKYDTQSIVTDRGRRLFTRPIDEKTSDVNSIQKKVKENIELEYYPKNPYTLKPNGRIDNFRQSYASVGDCYLLGTTIAIDITDAGKTVKNNIHFDGNKVKVTLPGANEDYVFSLAELRDSETRLSSGDADVRAIELANEQHRLKLLKSGNYVNASEKNINNLDRTIGEGTLAKPLDGGTSEEAFFLLTGKKPVTYLPLNLSKQFIDLLKSKTVETPEKEKLKAELKKIYGGQSDKGIHYDVSTPLDLKEKHPQRFAVTAGFKLNKGQMISDHTFAVKKVEKDFITVINPWDSSKEIKIPKQDFLENIFNVVVCDMEQK